MENASKALIIAGATLIGVMVLSMFLYVFREAAKTNANYDERQSMYQLQKHNQKFEVYNKDNNTIIDLITVINLARDVNIEYDYDPDSNMEVLINMHGIYYWLPNKKIVNNTNDEIDIEKNKIAVLAASPTAGITIKEEQCKSVYNLINTPLKGDNSLGINWSEITDGDRLNTCNLSNDNESNLNKTIYKFLFRCTGIEYHKDSNTVSKMSFELGRNPEYK